MNFIADNRLTNVKYVFSRIHPAKGSVISVGFHFLSYHNFHH